jgi:hypothetical protein
MDPWQGPNPGNKARLRVERVHTNLGPNGRCRLCRAHRLFDSGPSRKFATVCQVFFFFFWLPVSLFFFTLNTPPSDVQVWQSATIRSHLPKSCLYCVFHSNYALTYSRTRLSQSAINQETDRVIVSTRPDPVASRS